MHGIGEQKRGDTLVNWLDTMISTINQATLGEVVASVEWSELVRYSPRDDSPAHAVVRIRGDRIDERWIVVEGWWAEAFIAPAFSQLVSWSFQAVPWALAMHAAQRLHQSRDESVAYRRLMKQASAIALALATLFLAPFIVLFLGSLALIGIIPSSRLRTAIGRFQRALSATAGDSFVFLESPVRAAAMCSAIIAAFARLDELCAAEGDCGKRIVVAHSQGATVCLEALKRLAQGAPALAHNQPTENGADDRSLVLVTFGPGINKLAALRWLSSQSRDVGGGKDRTFIDRDPVRSASVGLVVMALVGFWFWRLWGTGQLTPTDLWTIPLGYFGFGLVFLGSAWLLVRLGKRFTDHYPWIDKHGPTLLAITLTATMIGLIALTDLDDKKPVMPFALATIVGILVLGAVRLALSRDVQERIRGTIYSPEVTEWHDFWATADPVPNGETRTKIQERPRSTRIWNEWSLLRDHTTYWQNRDEFVLPLVRILATTARSAWCNKLPPAHESIHERSRWRTAWLKGVRWLVPLAVSVAVFRRSDDLDAVRATMANALSEIGFAEWLERVPPSVATLTVNGGVAVLCASISYLMLRALWHAWVGAEQDRLLQHNPPTGITPGLQVLAAFTFVFIVGAIYVANTGWPAMKSNWQGATLGDVTMGFAVIVVWSQIILWLIAKVFRPPSAL